jgi:hypothetical protein
MESGRSAVEVGSISSIKYQVSRHKTMDASFTCMNKITNISLLNAKNVGHFRHYRHFKYFMNFRHFKLYELITL